MDNTQKPIIHISKNGPFVISHLRKIIDADGIAHSINDQTVAICRCGQTKGSPFCDGSHGKIDFNDEKEEDRVPIKFKDYIGNEITIHYNLGICAHVGYCTKGLPEVFDGNKRPWIQPDQSTVDQIIKIIKKCPSGALSYTLNDIHYDHYSDKEKIKLSPNGPLEVSGSIILDNDDEALVAKEHYTLCRCGHSKNKPFCNGHHWSVYYAESGKMHIKPIQNMYDQDNLDEKILAVQKLALSGMSEYNSMATLEKFPDFSQVLFRGSQLATMPENEDIPVNLKTVLGKNAKKPLELDLPFYVSHMSYGAISKEAKIALSKGATLVGTAMCSGEGGMLKESRQHATKYIYELGTADFSHDDEIMKQADAIEIKIGQGVKPGLGGHLPSHKVTKEIAEIRNLSQGEDAISPGRFHGIDETKDLINLVKHIRNITNGVPVGIKIATGHLEEDIAIAFMANPDFLTIDCRGGSTGSSPKILKDNVGIPPIFAISRARRMLDQLGSDMALCATGGFRDSSDIAKGLALGADAIALATASLVSIGCIQAKVCHKGTCPVGIATQDEVLRKLFNEEKGIKGFENYYNGTADELRTYARINGKTNIHDLCDTDLMTTSNEVSQNTNIKHV